MITLRVCTMKSRIGMGKHGNTPIEQVIGAECESWVRYVYYNFEHIDFNDEVKKAAKVLKAAIAPLIIGLLLTTSVPSKQTYLFMVGGRVVDSAVDSNPEIKELPANTLNLLNEYIKQKTDDLYQEKEKKSQKK